MQVFVVGAHGQVGQLLVQTLCDNDYTVVGGYREPTSQAPQATAEFSPVKFDLSDSLATMTAALKGSDAVIFTAGSRGKALLAVDLDGAVKVMTAAEKAGVHRFIQLSTLNAEVRSQWPDSLHDYYIAKYYADEWLAHRTQLDYVIVQPTTLTNTEATGAIKLEATWQDTITRQDVASVLAHTLEADLHRETIKIANGTLPIAQAFD